MEKRYSAQPGSFSCVAQQRKVEGVPMPLPVRSRRYDDAFWQDLLGKKDGKRSSKDINEELGY